jgi:hypothetical protein
LPKDGSLASLAGTLPTADGFPVGGAKGTAGKVAVAVDRGICASIETDAISP